MTTPPTLSPDEILRLRQLLSLRNEDDPDLIDAEIFKMGLTVSDAQTRVERQDARQKRKRP